jgi:hypothetical protein
MGLFTPTGVNKESDKAAQILKSFISKYLPIKYLSPTKIIEAHAPAGKGKIPTEAITNAKGLAIFSAIRAGMVINISLCSLS